MPKLDKENYQRRTLLVLADGELTRNEEFMGEDHLVVPIVALVEGVIHSGNAPEPELALASEFAKQPDGWNGRPVVVDHPEVNGEKVSANSPKVLESEQVGQLFNTVRDGTRLKTEAWINLSRVETFGGVIEETVKKLQNGEKVEISTGIFVNIEHKAGRFNDKDFAGVWRDVIPDHLALLSEGKGACSIADGCGAPRINAEGICEECGDTHMTKKPKDSRTLVQRLEDAICRLTGNELSDTDTRDALQAALELTGGDFSIVTAVFSDEFIFATFDGLFRQGFEIAEDGTISLGETIERVRPETSFVPVKTNEEIEMANKEAVAALVLNKATKFVEDDTEWLLSLDDEQFAKLVPEEKEPAPVEPEPAPAAAQEPAAAPAPVVEPEGEPAPQTLDEYIEKAPPAIGEVLKQGIKLQDERKKELTTAVLANGKNPYSEEELQGMSMDSLEKVATLAGVDDFTARGGPRTHQEPVNPLQAPQMPLVFPEPKADAA